MRVTIYLSKFYDWDPIPKDVLVTEQDIAAGKVMPDRNGGYRMKVVKIRPGGTHRDFHVSERTLIEKIIEEKSDIRKAGRTLTRKEAVAHLIMDQDMANNYEMDWITKIEVHDDGPSEELFREVLAGHAKADHGRRPGRKNIPADHVEAHVKAYMEDKSPKDHADHLHHHFGVKAS